MGGDGYACGLDGGGGVIGLYLSAITLSLNMNIKYVQLFTCQLYFNKVFYKDIKTSYYGENKT